MHNTHNKIFEIVLDELEPESTNYIPKTEEWDKVAGTYKYPGYHYGFPPDIKVFKSNNRLYISFNEESKYELIQISSMVFKYKMPGSSYEGIVNFLPNETGKIKYMRYIWRSYLKTE